MQTKPQYTGQERKSPTSNHVPTKFWAHSGQTTAKKYFRGTTAREGGGMTGTETPCTSMLLSMA